MKEVLAELPDDALVPVGWLRDATRQEKGAGSEALLPVAEVARRCGRAESTVRAWCAAGELPGAFKLQGVAWRVPESSLKKFVAEQQDPRWS